MAEPLSPLLYLHQAARAHAAREAVVAGARRLNYAELHRRALAQTGWLRGAGVRSGDRVALLAHNTLAALEAQFAVPASGAALVPLNVRLSTDDLRVILEDCRPTFALVDPDLAELFPDDRSIRVLPLGGLDYEQHLEAAEPARDLLAYVRDEGARLSINYTSGTTGRPKGAVYTHRGAFLQGANVARAVGLNSDSVYLWTLPLFHCNGWAFPWGVTAVAARHVMLAKPAAAEIWSLLGAESVSHYCCAPTVQISVLAYSAVTPLARPVTVAMGGAPPTPALIGAMRQAGFEALHLYGLTETYGPKTAMLASGEAVAGLPREEQAAVLARQGLPLSPTDAMRVVDDDGADVPADGQTMGEVRLSGETVISEYYGRPEETAASLAGGWLRTGDLAVLFPDGSLELRDRSKDIIISGGENVSSIEVERVLAEHPAVLESAVVAMPDPRWGERPQAFVTLRAGASAGEAELIAFCRERLAHFKCPTTVSFGELPKTATGKVLKRQLRVSGFAETELPATLGQSPAESKTP